jgi:hypothetical protein
VNRTQATRTLALTTLALFVLPVVGDAQQGAAKALAPIGSDAFEVMRHVFAYDLGIPLDARVVDTVDHDGSTREKIVFRGPRDSRVPGYLAAPTGGTPPYPCVLVMHGIGSSKEDWWEDDSFPSGGLLTRQLLAAGFAVLTLDAEYHGERQAGNDYESPMVFALQKGWLARTRDMIAQATTEYRRAID